MITLHPIIAREISAAINRRSVANDMIDTVLRSRPYQHDAFLFWVNAHREASFKLSAMGINVVTYNEQGATTNEATV